MRTPRKICVVTGSRAEYGHLYWVLKEIKRVRDLDLQVLVTGMHLSSEFGLTYKDIEADGFSITRRVDMLLSSDSSAGIAESTALGLIGIAEAFKSLQPDIVLMLGDRFELLAAASAALFANLPIAHVHGGESTVGAFDEAIRHSITKMSHIHFTSTENYRRRVIQLGENPDRVFNVGAPGLDNIRRLELLDRATLEEVIGMNLGPRSLLVAWHSVTQEPGRVREDFQILLNTLDQLSGVKMIFTKANADTGGRAINEMIDHYVNCHPRQSVVYTSLGSVRYLSALKHVDGLIGNSSSGIIEAPSLETGSVNIGDRQRGRVKSKSVIDSASDEKSISIALNKLFSSRYKKTLRGVHNPYDGGEDVAGKIVDILRLTMLDDIIKKRFYDLVLPEKSL